MIQVGKRYVNTTDIMQLYYTSSITDNRLNEIGTLAKGDVFVLLKVFIPDGGGSVLKVLAPDGTIGWFWTSQRYIDNFLFPMEDSTQ